MPRKPLDTISQERLVAELKLALDANDTQRVERLVHENPRSAFSDHVLRDIGKRRAARLATSPRATSD